MRKIFGSVLARLALYWSRDILLAQRCALIVNQNILRSPKSGTLTQGQAIDTVVESIEGQIVAIEALLGIDENYPV